MGGLVVVGAHPDDETVGAASLVLRAQRASVVHLTDGAPRDPRLRPGHADRHAYARLRRREALEALALAGLAPQDIVSLGAVDEEAVLFLAPLARELAAILSARAPRIVVTHAFEGGHPDHDAAAVAVRAALVLIRRREGRGPRLVEMTGHHMAGGRRVTGTFLAGPLQAIPHRLSHEERERKRRMLDRYASQQAVLSISDVAEERFRVAPRLWPWPGLRAGPLDYEVLGWTTFEEFRARLLEGLRALGIEDLEESASASALGAPG